VTAGSRRVTLRAEVDGSDRRNLWAFLDPDGSLVIEGQDLGPATAIVSADGEYEWTRTIRAGHLPRLLELLDAPADADVLDELERRWTGVASYELERRIREGDLPNELGTWSG
jgi:hypothetical protein